jgi:hypothetical protein
MLMITFCAKAQKRQTGVFTRQKLAYFLYYEL